MRPGCDLSVGPENLHTKYFVSPPPLTVTTHRKHATEIAKEISLDYDAIVILSGDGLAHEIFNGFAEHENPRAAFAIPLAPVPTGSGNGTCLSLLGLKVLAGSPVYGELSSSAVDADVVLFRLGRS